MSLNSELSARIFSFVSAALLKPLIKDGPDGTLGQRLQRDMSEPVIVTGPGERRHRDIRAGRDAAGAVRSLIRVQTAATDIGVDIFGGREAGPSLLAFQGDALEAIFMAVTLLGADGRGFSTLEVDGIIRLATSIAPAGVTMRDILLDPRRQPPAVDPRGGDIPGIPGLPGVGGIPLDLLKEAEIIRQRGCAGAVASAMGRWGQTIWMLTPRYIEHAIEELAPPDGCPGDELRIIGQGFGGFFRPLSYVHRGWRADCCHPRRQYPRLD